jgi:hypothetical protein
MVGRPVGTGHGLGIALPVATSRRKVLQGAAMVYFALFNKGMAGKPYRRDARMVGLTVTENALLWRYRRGALSEGNQPTPKDA